MDIFILLYPYWNVEKIYSIRNSCQNTVQYTPRLLITLTILPIDGKTMRWKYFCSQRGESYILREAFAWGEPAIFPQHLYFCDSVVFC